MIRPGKPKGEPDSEFINSDTYGCGSGRYTGSRHWTYNPPYLEWGRQKAASTRAD